MFFCYTALNTLSVKNCAQPNKKIHKKKNKIFMNDKSEENFINLYSAVRVSSEKTR